MNIAVATSEHADGSLAETLADLLGHAGHDVHTIPVQELQHAEDLRHTQALILVTADAELPDVAAHISDLARPGSSSPTPACGTVFRCLTTPR